MSGSVPILCDVGGRIDPLDSGDDSPCVLFDKCSFMGIIDHFRVGAFVFDDSHFKLFSFEQFYIGCCSCLMTSKRYLPCGGVPVGILTCDPYG